MKQAAAKMAGMNTSTRLLPDNTTAPDLLELKVKPQPNRRHGLIWLATLVFAATSAGCDALDPYADKWQNVNIGDVRQVVVALMGAPTTLNAVSLPLISGEQADWQVIGSRRYTVYFVMDHVVMKSVAKR